jgi:glycosyltransferase involved in cell wall biosynthesis
MISIIIPSYNYARFLPDAVESALAQAGPELRIEVLVVDDGSTDDTAGVAERFGGRIRYHFQANAGLSAARNTGMRLASHDLVIFLDADDLLAPGAVAALLAARAAQDPPPAVLAGRDQPIGLDQRPLAPAPVETGRVTPVPARLLALRNRFAPGVLADRRVLLELGGFDPALRASEDRDMWIRAAARHPVALLDRVTLLKRDHGANMSRHAVQQTAAIEQVLAKAFNNPGLHLSDADRRLARAVCCYQSALMHADAGDPGTAARQMLRSILHYPLGPGLRDAAIPPWSRLRGLAGLARKSIR